MRKTFYVAGPMRGVPKFNYPLFDEVAAALHRKGHNVINPADLDRRINPAVEQADGFLEGDAEKWKSAIGMSFHKVIGQDLSLIIHSADGLVMLPGWEQSEGAVHEKYVADATGKEVLHAHKAPTGQWLFVERVPAAMPQPLKIVGERGSSVAAGQVGCDECGRPYSHTTDSCTFVADGGDGGNGKRQPLTVVVGLMGYAQVGKDTLAAGLVKHHGFERIAFADALRDCLYAVNPQLHDGRTGNVHDEFGDLWHGPTTVQRLVDLVGWDEAKQNPEVRALLQRMGTEAGRNILGTDIWVETAMRKIQPGGKYVITDVRFPNEFVAVRALGGKLIRIKREGYGPVNDHWSEKALDGFMPDLVIYNDGSPTHLLRQVVAGASA